MQRSEKKNVKLIFVHFRITLNILEYNLMKQCIRIIISCIVDMMMDTPFRNAGAAKNHVIRILFIYFEQGVSFLDQAVITFQNVSRKYC